MTDPTIAPFETLRRVQSEHLFAKIENDLGVLKWMLTTNVGLTLVILGKLFFGH